MFLLLNYTHLLPRTLSAKYYQQNETEQSGLWKIYGESKTNPTQWIFWHSCVELGGEYKL